MEIEWASMDSKKGTLFLLEKGVYFQPYDVNEKPPSLLGDAVSLNKTGIFGAANMYKKLQDTELDLSIIAKNIRKDKEIDSLVKEGIIIQIQWDKIREIKKKWFSRSVILFTKDGIKITVGDPASSREAVFKLVSERLNE